MLKVENRNKRQLYVAGTVIVNAVITCLLAFGAPTAELKLFSVNHQVQFALQLDRFGAAFAVLVSILWIIAIFYAFEYIKHEGRETRFMAFYTMTLGVTLGIAFSANTMTLYLFYELLTLVTCPLVCHSGTKEAITALRYYVAYSLGSAALGLMGIAGLAVLTGRTEFVLGGVLGSLTQYENVMLFFFICAFFGFGMKAAVVPLHGWLPRASVAPTPVTALLHAVAVVKAGVFAITRVTYFSFGTEFLKGTTVQTIAILICIATILFGSTKAAFTKHLKRRLAYSTVSQLSYIVFGMMMMSPEGFSAGMLHLAAHAVAKITLFYCAGAILYKTGKEYVWELAGIGRKMPVTMAAFLIASLSLTGIPPLSGFFSKWYLISAAVNSKTTLGIIGAVTLIISAFLTAIYLLGICLNAFMPSKTELAAVEAGESRMDSHHRVEDPNWYMKGPLVVLSAVTILFGFAASPLASYFAGIVTTIAP